MAPSSSGQDRGFSALKPGFDSPWRYTTKGRVVSRPLALLCAMRFAPRYLSLIVRVSTCLALATTGLCALAEADPPRLTIEQAVQSALQNNPSLRAARFETQAACAEADRDKPVIRPRIAAEAQMLLQGPAVTFPRGAEDALVLPERYAQIKLMLDQPIYRAGLGDAWRRYRAMIDAAECRQRITTNDVIRDVRHAYVQCLVARAMLEVAREAKSVAADHLALVKRMVESGLSAPRDTLSAEADLAEADEGLLRASEGVALAVGDLTRLIGGKTSVTADLLTAPDPLPAAPTTEEAVAQAQARRPELIALRKAIEAAEAGHALARLQSSPAFSIRAAAVHQTPTAFTSQRWAGLGLHMEWPLADAGKTASDVRLAAARLDQLRAQLDEAESGILLEVRDALSRCETARARTTVCAQRLAAARAALEISRMRYEQRAATLLELASSRLAVTKADAAWQQAKLDQVMAWADIRRATAADIAAGTGEP